jgi:hypothetical protein
MHCGFLLLTSFFNQAVLTNIEVQHEPSDFDGHPYPQLLIYPKRKRQPSTVHHSLGLLLQFLTFNVGYLMAQILLLLSQQMLSLGATQASVGRSARFLFQRKAVSLWLPT